MRVWLLSLIFIVAPSVLLAATDGIYQLTEVTSSAIWDGTDAVLPLAPTPDYDAVFGDDMFLTYNLPASFSDFTFSDEPYDKITVDTNGNVWFGYSGSAYSFSLPSAGKGPVISAWNDDLSSYVAGGVFIQHKTHPERVVVEWQTETYTDEGTSQLSNFEVILFADGKIRVDYKDFKAANAKDFGSGIAKDDGTHYLSLTSNYKKVHSLSGRLFQFAEIPQSRKQTLTVMFSGTVTSTPAAIACNTDCSAQFSPGTPITLQPAPSQYSPFTGWTNGACSGIGYCLLTLTADSSVTAVFDYDAAHQVKVTGRSTSYFPTMQAAYMALATGDAVNLWATTYSENLICNRPVGTIFRGGYDRNYTRISVKSGAERCSENQEWCRQGKWPATQIDSKITFVKVLRSIS